MGSRSLAVFATCLLIGFAVTLPAQTKEGGMPAPGKGILDVTVVDEASKPLQGVLVSVPGYRSTTGLGGTCRFGLHPGRYAVLISKPGYRGRRVNAGVRPGETTTTRITLQKLPTRKLQGAPATKP
ncbi:MAG: carboxypeptidase-like regulatory domain-containing protein [Acidobacteriia bacterium]|nr:carboxypeptidase-like regulatory domain-containing protein [Terriglobia bacterium]